jgi:hypothetical protein
MLISGVDVTKLTQAKAAWAGHPQVGRPSHPSSRPLNIRPQNIREIPG